MDDADNIGESVSAGISGLDAILEHRMRLGACVLLSRADALSFSRLKELLGATDGNLGAQMRKLEDAQYVEARKQFQNRRPVTWYALTVLGREALKAHLASLETLINGSVTR
jgi:DNA-binding MarR family transcriptional regulator